MYVQRTFNQSICRLSKEDKNVDMGNSRDVDVLYLRTKARFRIIMERCELHIYVPSFEGTYMDKLWIHMTIIYISDT